MKFRRDKARDRLILDDIPKKFLMRECRNTIKEKNHGALKVVHRKTETLKPRLLEIAYDSETAINDFAKRMNKKADAVYQSLRRIRIFVAECMEQKIYKS